MSDDRHEKAIRHTSMDSVIGLFKSFTSNFVVQKRKTQISLGRTFTELAQPRVGRQPHVKLKPSSPLSASPAPWASPRAVPVPLDLIFLSSAHV